MADLYGRRARVTVGRPGENALVLDSGRSPARGWRIAFEVEKSLKSSLNQGTVRVWNLGDTSQARILQDRNRLLLQAGYDSERDTSERPLATLFRGQVTRGDEMWAEDVHPGAFIETDWVTTIECLDGYDAVQQAEVGVPRRNRRGVVELEALTLRAGTALRDVVLRVANFLTAGGDVVLGDLDAAITRILSDATARGLPTALRRRRQIEGRAGDWLDRIGRMYRFDWSIQDGVLELHPWEAIWSAEQIEVSVASGLVGVPSKLFSATKDSGTVQAVVGVKFATLLRPEIRPGVLVKIASEKIDGTFRVHRARYSGDTVDGNFQTAVTAYLLPGALEGYDPGRGGAVGGRRRGHH